MFNPHPPLSHFPFVLFSLCLILHAVHYFFPSERLKSSILVLAPISLISIFIVFVSGYWGVDFAERSFRIDSDLIETHRSYARLSLYTAVLALTLFCASQMNPAKALARLSFFSYLMCFGLVIYTSLRGGDLVFSHGAGVKIEEIPSALKQVD